MYNIYYIESAQLNIFLNKFKLIFFIFELLYVVASGLSYLPIDVSIMSVFSFAIVASLV